MSAPFEIVCAPYEVWLAPVGTAFPALDVVPETPWAKLGTSGFLNYTDAGVTVTHSQTVNEFVSAGSTSARKRWRTLEGIKVSLVLADLSPTEYAKVVDGATITTVAPGPTLAGSSKFELMRGVQVHMYALIVRGISPVDEALTAQYEIPAANESGSPAPVFSKANPAELAVEFDAFELNPGELAQYNVQTAAHTGA